MPYIHEHPDWPRFHWNAAAIASQLAEVRHAQGRMLGGMESLGFDLQVQASVVNLTADVVKSSAIEGEQLDPELVRSSIVRQLGLEHAGFSAPARNVDGVVRMLLDATQRFDRPLTHERLFDWHSSLFPAAISGHRRIVVGAWRTPEAGPMQVVSGPIGLERVHFEAPSASRVHAEMDAFLTWFESPVTLDPVVRAALAHFWFVTIHPFQDGNGRIARAIADLALARADQSPRRFYSMSSQIEKERKDYYAVLERQQKSDLDVTPWLCWFLACLSRAIAAAESARQAAIARTRFLERLNLHPVNERQRLVLARMLGEFEGYLNTSKYAKLAKCSTDSALRDIKELVAHGLLVKNPGSGRSTSYRLSDIGD